ncbi:MAG: hypothetical protein JF887_10025 [Candidatus Dormibacteraeota bacterium]|uniref:Uncharacterized protein n=1 Tax=Candidatus Amunia macphersoniae TaxID=3127014 RepID=A0A934KHV9_9BACT|nr:hypothetical protein [Candidatus Dormibacteraeota bacterium]
MRAAARWVGHHTLPAAAATVLAVGAAGGGIGYSIAGQHAAAAVAASTGPATQPSGGNGKAGSGTRATRGEALIQKALARLATETGQSVASIRAQLAAGKSVDAIAGPKAPAIETDILGQLTKLGDRAVKAGKITATQETTYLAMAKTRVEALMAEPGTQLMQDLQRFLHDVSAHGLGHAGHQATAPPAAPSATPAA